MGDVAVTSRAQELGSRVWHLPHVRLAVFQHLADDAAKLDEEGAARAELLKSFLTLDKGTSRDVALLLYPYMDLDKFPWNCPDQDRKRAYAAGVQYLNVTGCLPLFGQWKGFAELLDFFPNVEGIFFDYIGITFSRVDRFLYRPPEQNPRNVFSFFQEVWEEDDGSITALRSFEAPEGLDCQVARRLRSGYHLGDQKPFSIGNNGRVVLPDIFRTPLQILELRPMRDHHGDWLTMLHHRKAAGLPIEELHWSMGAGEEVDLAGRIAEIVPPGLRSLKLSTGTMEPVSETLDVLMDIINVRTFPDLKHFSMEIKFFQEGDPDTLSRQTQPQWMLNDLPPDLKVDVDLIILDHGTDTRSDDAYVGELMADALPATWIRNFRRKFGHDTESLTVETHRMGPGPQRVLRTPPIAEVLHYALNGPLDGPHFDPPRASSPSLD